MQHKNRTDRFTSYKDAYDLIYPSKKFYFNKQSSNHGINVWFRGYMEIRCNDGILSLYAGGFEISKLYNRGDKFKADDVKDKMVRFFAMDSYREYPLVIHLPDKNESKPYIYFEPMKMVDFREAFDSRYKNNISWEWFEPDVDSKSADIICHPESIEPTPIRYVMQ